MSAGHDRQPEGGGLDASPLTVCITRTVRAGCEAAFEQALHAFARDSLALPGQLGVHIMRPAPGSGSREYGVVRKFASRSALEDFRASPLYQDWNRTTLDLTEGTGRVEELNGLESWFTLPGGPIRPPPKWRMAVVTWLGVNLVTTPLLIWLMPVLTRRVSFPWDNFLFNAPVVALLTWAVMPLLTRLLRRWMQPAT